MVEISNISESVPNLTSWSRFEANKRGKHPLYQTAYDFRARWRFASSFRGVETFGYKTGLVVEGYSELLRLLLACTAREQLADIFGKKYYELSLDNKALSARVREELKRNVQFDQSLRKGARKNLSDRLDKFKGGVSSDLVPIAFSMRNGVAHGSITPSGCKLANPDGVKLIKDLGDALLADSDRLFTVWVNGKWPTS